MDEWGVGRAGINDGLVILFDLDTTLEHGQVQLYAGSGFARRRISTQDELQAIFDDDMLPLLAGRRPRLGDPRRPLPRSSRRPSRRPVRAGRRRPAAAGPPPGPPFPEPETDRAVYDYAGIFSRDRSSRPRRRSTRSRRGPAPRSSSTPRTAGYVRHRRPRRPRRRARALIDQWGIGRAGFNDGLVIFFDLRPNLAARPGPALRRARASRPPTCRTASARRSSTNDMLPLPARRPTSTRALAVGPRARSMPRRRPSTPAQLQTRPPGQRRARAGRRADRVHGPVGLGVLSTGGASARTRSTSTTRRS